MVMISVIIPLYNKSAAVERSVRSVLTQSFRDFELIIVDDGSTDDSLGIVKRIQDDRIVIVEQENGGPSKARNTGVQHAKGEWIVFLDADDELLPDALKIMYQRAQMFSDADLIDFNKYLRVGEKLIPQKHPIIGKVEIPLRAWYYRLIAPGCGHTIFHRCFIEKFPYDERLRRYEDADLLVRMLRDANVFSSNEYTEIHDMNTVAASNARKDIREDYLGYLDLHRQNFWQRMCQYRLFVEERGYYQDSCHRLYPSWYNRYDLFLLYKLLPKLKVFFYS